MEWGSALLRPFRKRQLSGRFYEKWGHIVVHRPWTCLTAGVLLLVALGIPAFQLRVASVEAKNIPVRAESRRGYESLSQNLGSGWMMPATILVQHPSSDWISNGGLNDEKTLVQKLEAIPNTEQVITVSDASGARTARQARMALLTGYPDASQSVILVLSRVDPQSPPARVWLDRIADTLRLAQVPQGPRYFLGGLPSVTLSADRVIESALPEVIFVTLCSTFVLLLIFMRSLLVALKAIVLNLLCVLAAYGFQVLCFQDGWGTQHLPFHRYGRLEFGGAGHLFLRAVWPLHGLRGLHSQRRARELARSAQHPTRRAGRTRPSGRDHLFRRDHHDLRVFLSFGFVDVVEIEQLGVGLSFAILLDATVIRLLLVPSIMTIMGRWAFWCPGHPLPVSTRHERGHHYNDEKLKAPAEGNFRF